MKDPMPGPPVQPMEPVARERPFDDPACLFEPKWDGVRYLAFVSGGQVRLQNRRLRDKTELYPELQRLGAQLGTADAIVDGEIAAMDGSRPSFPLVLRRDLARRPRPSPGVVYAVFDILYAGGRDLRPHPLAERKACLERVLTPSDLCFPVEGTVESGRELFSAMDAAGWEGVVAKELDSPYRGGKQRWWVKVKCRRRVWATIIGCTQEAGRGQGRGALLVAVPDGEGLAYAGRVRSGVSAGDWERLVSHLAANRSTAPPATGVPRAVAGQAVWTRPDLEVLVAFQEWTPDGALRAPSIKGFRAREVAPL